MLLAFSPLPPPHPTPADIAQLLLLAISAPATPPPAHPPTPGGRLVLGPSLEAAPDFRGHMVLVRKEGGKFRGRIETNIQDEYPNRKRYHSFVRIGDGTEIPESAGVQCGAAREGWLRT